MAEDSAIGTKFSYENYLPQASVELPFNPCLASKHSQMITAMLGKCANPGCNCEFKRLGTGRIYTLQVRDPERWGLPEHVKQKVVWLCAKCDHHKKIRFDHERCQVVIVNRHEHLRQTA